MNFQFRKNSQVARPLPKKVQNKKVQCKKAQGKNVNSAKKEDHTVHIDQIYDHGKSEHVERIVPHKHDATYKSKSKETNVTADDYKLQINIGKNGVTKYCVDGSYTFDSCTKEGYNKKSDHKDISSNKLCKTIASTKEITHGGNAHTKIGGEFTHTYEADALNIGGSASTLTNKTDHKHVTSSKKCKTIDSTKEITNGGKVDLTVGGTFDISADYHVLKENITIHENLEESITLYDCAEYSSVMRRVKSDGTVVESWSLKPIEVLGSDKKPHTIFAYVKDQ